MDIMIFDMDGVLLEAKGYHQALRETVHIAAEHLSLDNIDLTQEQIHRFEALGISSEWHSSALCMAFLQIKLLSGENSPTLDLEGFFTILERQPLKLQAIERGVSAAETLCQDRGVDPKAVKSTILYSEDIDRSLTMQWFQELVLGSKSYQGHYQKSGMNNTQSYLRMYDVPILTSKNAKLIKRWADTEGYGAAIMTNRPSSGPPGFSGSPEAELGLNLVQLSGIPLIGHGEIGWLAERAHTEPGTLVKPNATHALAAIFNSFYIDKEKSLKYASMDPGQWPDEITDIFRSSTITVFEDTPAGIVSVQNAGEALSRAGNDVKIRAMGIAKEKSKQAALASQGARVFPDINTALSKIEDFRAIASD